jgi:hypothetical protein
MLVRAGFEATLFDRLLWRRPIMSAFRRAALAAVEHELATAWR